MKEKLSQRFKWIIDSNEKEQKRDREERTEKVPTFKQKERASGNEKTQMNDLTAASELCGICNVSSSWKRYSTRKKNHDLIQTGINFIVSRLTLAATAWTKWIFYCTHCLNKPYSVCVRVWATEWERERELQINPGCTLIFQLSCMKYPYAYHFTFIIHARLPVGTNDGRRLLSVFFSSIIIVHSLAHR